MNSYEVGVKGTDWTRIIDAESAGKAKYQYLREVQDAWENVSFKDLTCHSLGAEKPKVDPAQVDADHWNHQHPIGTEVEYWTWTRGGESKVSRTRTVAHVVCGTAVVWVEGEASCISLSHVDALESRP